MSTLADLAGTAKGLARRTALLLAGAEALGVGFLGVKAYGYSREYADGLLPAVSDPTRFDGPVELLYMNLYLISPGLHALHVLTGTLLPAGMGVAIGTLTVGVCFVATGLTSLVANLAIAAVKAALVFWFYIHLRGAGGLVRVFAIGAGAWLLIMLLLAGTDYATRLAA